MITAEESSLACEKEIARLIEELGIDPCSGSLSENDTADDAEWDLVRLGDKALPAVTAALRHENFRVRFHAASILSRVARMESEEALKAALKDHNSLVRSVAVEKLHVDSREYGMTQLLQALDGDGGDACHSVLGTSTESAPPDFISQILSMLEHAENGDLRCLAAKALGSFGNKDARIQQLRADRAKDAVPVLIKALTDTYSWVRFRAAQALGKMWASDAVPALIKAMGDDKPWVRYAVVTALGTIATAGCCRREHERTALPLEIVNNETTHPLLRALVDQDGYVWSDVMRDVQKILATEVFRNLAAALSEGGDDNWGEARNGLAEICHD